MNTIIETKKRLKIAKKVGSSLEGIVKGVLLGGSMGFGQNYSVTDKSDIDLVIVIDLLKFKELESSWFFKKEIKQEVEILFKENNINFFWVTRKLDGVEVNAFVYKTQSYIDFCLLKGNLKGFISNRPSDTQEVYGFSGEKIIFYRNLKQINDGFIYEKPSLVNGKYWGGPPRQDFFYSSQILYQDENFLSDLENKVWKTTIKQLIKEYGKKPNLDKFNILNTHYTYQTAKNKLPYKIIEQIQERTKKELDNI